jgi:hypothetical protein
MKTNLEKYGIPLVKRKAIEPRKSRLPSEDVRTETIDAAKRVISEHRETIRALAKR